MCTSNPYQSEVHLEVYEWAKQLSNHLLPRSRAYHEIWLDEEKVAGSPEVEEVEPMYGPLYLPRKFKIGIAVPPSNDIDVFSQDLGLIAIVEEGKLVGFNVAIGGGMGSSHGDKETYPQLAKVIGFVHQINFKMWLKKSLPFSVIMETVQSEKMRASSIPLTV